MMAHIYRRGESDDDGLHISSPRVTFRDGDGFGVKGQVLIVGTLPNLTVIAFDDIGWVLDRGKLDGRQIPHPAPHPGNPGGAVTHPDYIPLALALSLLRRESLDGEIRGGNLWGQLWSLQEGEFGGGASVTDLWLILLCIIVAFGLEWHGYSEGKRKGFEQGYCQGRTDANLWWIKADEGVDQVRQEMWRENS